MTLVFTCFGILTLLELLVWVPWVWKFRKYLAGLIIIGLSASAGSMFGLDPSPWSTIMLILSIYRLINLLRIIEGRTNADYMYKVSLQTSLWLILSQLLILLFAGLAYILNIPGIVWWYAVATVQFIVAFILYSSTKRNLRSTHPPTMDSHLADRDLPNLTVAIPARNETDQLEMCLQSLIASNYPKLEIIVLDDCSQNKRTPEIIRGFAHDGVKFISGSPPPERWVAKNYAYQQLFESANGDVILFCGVDARFKPDSLRNIVELMHIKNKQMVSLLPNNAVPGKWRLEDLMVQPGRYSWELALPRRWLNRPPVLSTCWAISAQSLKAAGSFKAVAHSSSPESYFARFCVNKGDSYSFLISSDGIGVSSQKEFSEQKATAIRTRYPQVHRRPELVAIFSMSELLVLVVPYIALIVTIINQRWLLAMLFVVVCVLNVGFYRKIVDLTYRRFLWRGVWLLPFASLYDVSLLNYSMWQYEFREVIWKNRNVCIPMMRTIPKLPKLN